MVLSAPTADNAPAAGDWLDKIALGLRLSRRGILLLVAGGHAGRLRELVQRLLPTAPELDVLDGVARLETVPVGGTAVLCPRAVEADWMNMHRPLFAERRLKVVLFTDEQTAGALAQQAPDFFDWISQRVECPPGAPAHGPLGILAAVRARAPGIVWAGAGLAEALAAIRPGLSVRPVTVTAPYEELLAAARAPELLCWQLGEGGRGVHRARWAVAEAARRQPTIIAAGEDEAAGLSPGWWVLHGRCATLTSAIGRLTLGGAPGLLGALLGLEEEALALAERLIWKQGLGPREELARARDPGAVLARRALELGELTEDELLGSGPPLLRGLWRRPQVAKRRAEWTRRTARRVAAGEEVGMEALGRMVAWGRGGVSLETLKRAQGPVWALLAEGVLRSGTQDRETFRVLAAGARALGEPDAAEHWERRLSGEGRREQEPLRWSPLELDWRPPRKPDKPADKPWNVPYERNPDFLGRESLLAELDTALRKKGGVQVLRGLGGAGKTQAVVEFAWKHRGRYRAVLFARADSEASLQQSYMEIARHLGLSGDQAEESVQGVLRWLGRNERWLLLLDSADEPAVVKRFLPGEGHKGHVVVTTRAEACAAIGVAQPIEVPELSAEHSLEFLWRRTGRGRKDAGEEAAAAAELVRELDGLPLALEQAAAFMKETGASFRRYVEKYHEHRLELLHAERQPIRAQALPVEERRSVATTWLMNFRQVEQESEAAADLLRACSLLAPAPIPLELFTEGAVEMGPVLAEALAGAGEDPAVWEAVMAPLLACSLVRWDREAGVLRVHRLVQESVRSKLGWNMPYIWAERVVAAVALVFPSGNFKDWARCERLLSHARVAAELAQMETLTFEGISGLLCRMGNYLRSQFLLPEGETLLLRALTMIEQETGTDSIIVARVLANIANIYNFQGRYEEATELELRGLRIRERHREEFPYELARGLISLGLTLSDQGQTQKAESLIDLGLVLAEKVADDSSLELLIFGQRTLAGLYNRIGRYSEAEYIVKTAIDIMCRNNFPEEHPTRLGLLLMLGNIFYRQNKFVQAEEHFKRAISISSSIYGVDHIRTSDAQSGLAAIFVSQKKLKEAEILLRNSIRVTEEKLPRRAMVNNLAVVYFMKGNYKEAEKLFKEVFSARETSQAHTVVSASDWLATLYLRTGRQDEAEQVLKEALDRFPSHPPYIVPLMDMLASLYEKRGKLQEAAELQQELASMKEEGKDASMSEAATRPFSLLLPFHRQMPRNR